MKILFELNIGEIITAIVAFLALISATILGIYQHSINKKMLYIQEAVDLYVCFENVTVQNGTTTNLAPIIKVHNVSSLPICITKHNYNGIVKEVPPYRMPPASQFPNAAYWLPLPMDTSDHVSFEIFFVDAFNREWSVSGYGDKNTSILHWDITCNKPQRIKK